MAFAIAGHVLRGSSGSDALQLLKVGPELENKSAQGTVTLNVESVESTESPESAPMQTQSRCMSVGLSV